jgi:exfoliative toxin A/B
MERIKKIPIPLAGVMLGTAALGNLLMTYSPSIRIICGLLAAFLLILLILKLILYPGSVKEEMKNPVIAGVSGTFTMSVMILSTYIQPVIGKAAYYIWIAAILAHCALILYFTLTYIVHLDLNKVFTVYYIVYVGIAVAAVTAPAYNALPVGTAAFWFGFVTLLALFILVTVRYVRIPVKEPAKPLICIYAAPIALCTAGYIQSVTPKSLLFIEVMCVAANLVYLFAIIQALGLLKLPFYPSYAAFTFPFVISAIATKQTMAAAAKMGSPLPFLAPVVTVETLIAVIMVGYTYFRFMMAIFGSAKAKA